MLLVTATAAVHNALVYDRSHNMITLKLRCCQRLHNGCTTADSASPASKCKCLNLMLRLLPAAVLISHLVCKCVHLRSSGVDETAVRVTAVRSRSSWMLFAAAEC
eukprot:11060-Heterococcus_DN1.PRE.1